MGLQSVPANQVFVILFCVGISKLFDSFLVSYRRNRGMADRPQGGAEIQLLYGLAIALALLEVPTLSKVINPRFILVVFFAGSLGLLTVAVLAGLDEKGQPSPDDRSRPNIGRLANWMLVLFFATVFSTLFSSFQTKPVELLPQPVGGGPSKGVH